MREVIADTDTFQKKFPNLPKEGERIEAIKKYFAVGGVIKVYNSEKEWPKLGYPSYFVLEKKLREVKEKKNLFQKRLDSWNKKYKSASKYHSTNQVKKLKEPLYWKHMAKMATDADYRKDANSVGLPVHLVADDKWKPMVKMFVNDLDYRKQLSETVSKSIVYKKSRKVAKYADELKDFRMDVSDKQMKELDKKLDLLNKIEVSLKELQKWAKE
jgi:hypothetical protein